MSIPLKKVKKTTVREEFEYWNVVYVIRRLNYWYGRRINSYNIKHLQGMEAADFSMNVISKIVSGERSWQDSANNDFMSFVYGVARSEFSVWRDSNATKRLITLDANQENKSDLHIRDDYEGF